MVLESSAKFGLKCSGFREIEAILNPKNHTFALISQSILVIPTKLDGDIARGKGTLSVNLTSNDLDLGKW